MNKMTSTTTVNALPEPYRLHQTLRKELDGFGQVEWLQSTGSTNMDLSERIRSGVASTLDTLPWLRGAYLQTAGKGRAGRPWANQPGQCLMFSVAMASPVPIARLLGLAPALGVAAVLALRSQLDDPTRQRLTLKWPNDIFWDQAKLAGILVESVKHPSEPNPIVVAGIGLNLSGASRLTADMGRPIADWTQVCDQGVEIDQHHAEPAVLVCSIAQAWSQALHRFAELGFAGFIKDFQSMDVLRGNAVSVMDGGACLMQGLACGCDDSGRLLVQTIEGLKPVMVGDVSIRPVSKVTGSAEK